MIKIHNLKQIKSAQQFFNTDKVVLLELICIDDIHHPEAARLFQGRPNVITYGGKSFYLLILKGGPENLILKAKTGVPFPSPDGGSAWLQWKLNLPEAIAAGKLYDVSKIQTTSDYKANRFDIDPQYLISKYHQELTTYANG